MWWALFGIHPQAVAVGNSNVACNWSDITCRIHAGSTCGGCLENNKPQTANIANHGKDDDNFVGNINGPDWPDSIGIPFLHILPS